MEEVIQFHCDFSFESIGFRNIWWSLKSYRMFYNENCGNDAPNQIIYYENNVSNKKDQLSPKLRLKMTTWFLTI